MQLVSFSDYHDRKAGGNKGQASMSLRSTFLAPSPEKLGLSYEGGTLGLRCKQSRDDTDEVSRQVTPGRIPGLNHFP